MALLKLKATFFSGFWLEIFWLLKNISVLFKKKNNVMFLLFSFVIEFLLSIYILLFLRIYPSQFFFFFSFCLLSKRTIKSVIPTTNFLLTLLISTSIHWLCSSLIFIHQLSSSVILEFVAFFLCLFLNALVILSSYQN